LFALAYNRANFLPQLVLSKPIKSWTLTTLREKLIKIGVFDLSRWSRSRCPKWRPAGKDRLMGSQAERSYPERGENEKMSRLSFFSCIYPEPLGNFKYSLSETYSLSTDRSTG
jgi:hypothetical protein